MVATAATKASIMDKAKMYLDFWYIGGHPDTIDNIAQKVADDIVRANKNLMDKQVMHIVNHTDIVVKMCEELAKDTCIARSLSVTRPAKREPIDIEAKKKAQAEAEAIIKELMSVNPFEVIRYVSEDGTHEVKVTRGMGDPFIRVDGKPLRTHDYLLRVLKRNKWVKQD